MEEVENRSAEMERNLKERISTLETEKEAERLRTSEYEEMLIKGKTTKKTTRISEETGYTPLECTLS